MSPLKTVVLAALVTTTAFAGNLYGRESNDPYEILNKYFEAGGGLEILKGERTQYFEGALSVSGMQGSLRVWTEKPDRNRAEIEIGPLRQTEGDNGEIRWVIDTNGKLQIITKSDEVTLKRREVDRLTAEYEYADPASDVFSVTLEGTEEVEGAGCYVIKVTNNINVDHNTYYISIDDFELRKTVAIRGEKSADTYYDDYREVDGIMVAFYSREVHHQTGQAYEVALTHYESNPGIDPALFEPPVEGAKDYRFTTGEAAENIPFEFVGNHLFIPVTVAGTEQLFVLDTGAAMSVLDEAFALEIGLELEGSLKGAGAGGTVDVRFTTLPPFELRGISFDEQSVAVIEMGELIRRIGIDIAGILGFDFLSRFVTRIDYANELVSFYDPETFKYTGDGNLLDAHIDQSVFETQATLDGAHSGTWLFDLGASSTHLDGIYARREGYADRKGVLRMGHGAGNEYQLKAIKAESMEFAGFTVRAPLLGFAYGGTDTVFAGDRVGTLGNSLFRHFVVYVDYAKERVIVEKGDRFNGPWPEDRSGLNVGWTVDRDGVEVLYVSPDTPAERAGFKAGDVLKSIDGKPVEPSTGVITTREMLTGEPGTVYEILVNRAGAEKTLKLTLADLY